MNLTHLVAGLIVAGLVVGGLVVLETHMPADAQRLLVKNETADAQCRMEFNSGDVETFSIAKGAEYKKTYKDARPGFIGGRCTAGDRIIEFPGSFRLLSHALVQITLNDARVAELRIIQDQPASQPPS